MPVCKKCNKSSDSITRDFCPYCGAKDWVAEPKDSERESSRPAEVGFLRGIAIITGVFLWLAVGLIGLWLLITIIKWFLKLS